jgi:valyl-tRNA synthetase
MNIPPSKKAPIYICPNENCADIYKGNEDIFVKLASGECVIIEEAYTERDNALTVVTNTAKYSVPLDALIDKSKELDRLTKEKQKTEDEIARITAKLSNADFTAKAPERVVGAEKEKLIKYEALLSDIDKSLDSLK